VRPRLGWADMDRQVRRAYDAMLAKDAASAAVASALHGKIQKRKEIPRDTVPTREKKKPRGTAAPSSGRGLHSFTFQLNVSAFHGRGGARRGC